MINFFPLSAPYNQIECSIISYIYTLYRDSIWCCFNDANFCRYRFVGLHSGDIYYIVFTNFVIICFLFMPNIMTKFCECDACQYLEFDELGQNSNSSLRTCRFYVSFILTMTETISICFVIPHAVACSVFYTF
jgi:hypothetical protein